MFNRDTHLIFEAYYTRTYLAQEGSGDHYRTEAYGYLPGEYTYEGDRAGVIINIPEHGNLAFYKSSSGTGGKKIKDHWYPFFGFKSDWVIKGGSYHATDGYDFPQVKAVMDWLDNGPYGKHMSFNDEDGENFDIEGVHDGGTNSREDVWPEGSPQADFFKKLQTHIQYGGGDTLLGPDAFIKLGQLAYGEYDVSKSDGGAAVYDHIDNIFRNIGLEHEVPGYQHAGEANRRREQGQGEPEQPQPEQPQPEQPEGEQPEDEQLKFEFPKDEQPEPEQPEPEQPGQPEPKQPEQPDPEPVQPGPQPQPQPQPQRGVNRRLAILRRQQQQQQQQMGGMGQQQQQQQQQ